MVDNTQKQMGNASGVKNSLKKSKGNASKKL